MELCVKVNLVHGQYNLYKWLTSIVCSSTTLPVVLRVEDRMRAMAVIATNTAYMALAALNMCFPRCEWLQHNRFINRIYFCYKYKNVVLYLMCVNFLCILFWTI